MRTRKKKGTVLQGNVVLEDSWANGGPCSYRRQYRRSRPGSVCNRTYRQQGRRGWGLGLSLSMRIIKDIHAGNIRVSRSKPGDTVIKIMLPI